MPNDMTEYNPQSQAVFQRGGIQLGQAANVGSIAIEQERAIAEAQGQMVLAKRFPRSEAAATAKLMEACKSPEFAAQAFYSVPNRGSGPSIRFAEEVARVYQNFQYGHRELSRGDGKSEIEVYAWDVENNNFSRRQITVLHVRDTQQGPKPLRDQADIDNRIANVASKQMRGRILALVSKQLVADGIAACKRTLAGNSEEPIIARVNRMTQAFTSKCGVTAKNLEAYLGHSLDSVDTDEIAELQGVFNAIKDGARIADYFSDAKGAEAKEVALATADALTKVAEEGAQQRKVEQKKAATKKVDKPVVDTAVEQDSKVVKEESNPVEESTPEVHANAGQDVGADQQGHPDPASTDASEEDDVF